MSNPSFTSIPILDFAQATSSKLEFLEALREALVNVGFFYLRNAPVLAQTQEDFTKKALDLFDLPLQKKLEIEMVNSPHFLGYSRLGAEITALKPDHREQFDVGTRFTHLRVSTNFLLFLLKFATELPAPGSDEPLYRNVVGPNQWPDERALPGFRDAFDKYLFEVSNLAEQFPGLIAEALDLPSNAFDEVFDSPQQHKLKLIKYPAPTEASNGDSGFQGVGPHKDSGFLTFLLQGTPHHGLEVQNKSGTWVSAPPLPGTLVVNIGRSLEALTGGICTATTHRVSLRPENFEDSTGSLGPRFSFPVFQGVSLDLSAEKISLKIPESIRALVKDAKVKSDAEATFNKMFHGCIGEGTFVARVTSHQDVGQR
ncbi:Oxoglutarate/iron-dependent dioxygenase, partial [Penicillium brevicompactum]|uniref:Oxoglutarate/iron-dependent dioxygenase n=1 Tax=Penicillium brevicompactum TaxID=5074 RepID=UPI0025422C20